MPIARWSLLSKAAPKARSSHALSITHDGLLLMHGGELKPRQPVDTGTDDTASGSIHSFDLKSVCRETAHTGHWVTLSPPTQPSVPSSFPQPRVGSAAAWDKSTGSLYLWGGRGGIDMTPLDRLSAGPWRALMPSNPVQWQRLSEVNEDEAPEPRSYHTSLFFAVGSNAFHLTVTCYIFSRAQGKLYIHAGCPTSGRLNTLHAYDVSSNRWTSLASAPGPARGGTGLVAVTLAGQGAAILRFGGKNQLSRY
jgi:hypothetical protein